MATTLQDTFKYDLLDPAKNEIRILSGFSIVDDEVACKIFTVSLDDRPFYNALSYVWGDPTQTAPLCVGDSVLQVTTNLSQALLNIIRIFGTELTLWVDALCINQSDSAEKSSQVGLMGEIYSRAKNVLAWLGTSADHSDKAFQALKWLSEFNSEHKLADTEKQKFVLAEPGSSLRKLIESVDCGDDAGHQISLKPLETLFDRIWWQRLWTFQELALAKQLALICGLDVIAWGHITRARTTLHYLAFLTPSHHHRSTISRFMNEMWYSVEIWYEVSTDKSASKYLSLLNLLEVSGMRGRKATNPRDHIYGLLGIANDAIAERVEIDYQKNPMTLYTEIAGALIGTYGLDILSYCQPSISLETPSKSDVSSDEWPSWVPLWHKGAPKPFHKSTSLSPLRPGFSASKNISVTVQPRVYNQSSLICTGVLLDEIKATQNLPIKADAPRQWFDKLSALISNSEVYPSPDEKSQAVWRTPCADQVVGQSTKTLRRARYEDQIGVEKMLEKKAFSLLSSGTITKAEESYHDSWISVNLPTPRDVFVTKQGYLGFGYVGIKPGDVVCILATASVPHVLRRTGDLNYKFLGEAYVHGVMDGEVKLATSQVHDFTII